MERGSRSPNTSRCIRTRFRIKLGIREFDEAFVSYDDLTRLLNDAYRPLAEMGLNYVAATQDAAITRKRITAAAACWIAYTSDELVGTVCYYTGGHGADGPGRYSLGDVAHFGQLAVVPRLQRAGVGSALLDIVERRALAEGKSELACDTAELATDLIAFYQKRGFRIVERHRWSHARYVSVVLSKRLDS